MFWGPLRVTQLLRVEIDQRNDFAVFDLAFANLMQIRPPASIMLEIVGHMPREENVTGIAAIHYALSDVYSRSSNIGLFVEVSNRIDGPAMDSHAHAKLGIFFNSLASVAQSLALEIDNRGGWSVADYSSDNLAVLFGTREFFVWSCAANNGYQIQN